MSNAYFDFKKFRICHDKCAMKVGTDGVLLGAWAHPRAETAAVLDVGTGSGLVALMMAQKCGAQIWGIDIDEDAVGQAASNGAASPWADRLHFLHADALAYMPQEKFDMVVCNPPFFTESLQCPGKKRNLARHSGSLPFDNLIRRVCLWLGEGGAFHVVLPATVSDSFIQTAWANGLELHRCCLVHGRPDTPPKRALVELVKGRTATPLHSRLYIRDENGEYTEQYKALTGDYYLHF